VIDQFVWFLVFGVIGAEADSREYSPRGMIDGGKNSDDGKSSDGILTTIGILTIARSLTTAGASVNCSAKTTRSFPDQLTV
jgi:hypothetical protein